MDHTASTPPSTMHPYDEAEQAPDTAAKIIAEVANRLIEWGELESRTRVTHWLGTLMALHKQDPHAMWLYLNWQTGDTARIAASFEERGRESALPRQAVQQSTARAFDAIRAIMPDLAQAMREAFEIHAPEAKHQPQPAP